MSAAPMRAPKPETWGDGIKRQAQATDRVVSAIRSLAGDFYGTTNTFAKLHGMEEAPTDPTWRFRAWLLLTAWGFDPAAWGIEVDFPSALDLKRLKRQMDRHPDLVELRIRTSSCLYEAA